MAEKISVQIALEGGREIARQLEEIGQTGQKAFQDISKSAEQVGGFKQLDPGEVTNKLKALGIEGTAAFDKIQKAVQSAARLESIVQGVQGIESAFVALGRAAGPVGLAIVAGMQAAAKATIAFAETINKASDQAVKLGLSLEQFTKQRKSLEALGLSSQAAGDAMAHFQQAMAKAIAEADPGSSLALFGNAAKMASEQMGPFLERLRAMPAGIERTNLALSMFGPAAIGIIQGMRAAERSMSATEQKAYALGQAVERLKTAWDSFGSVTLAPTLTAGIDGLTAAVNGLNTAASRTATSFATWAQAVGSLNPIQITLEGITALLNSAGQAGAQAGQQAAQGLQLMANPLTGMPEAFRAVGAAAQQAGQQSAQGATQAQSAWQQVLDLLLKITGLKGPAITGGEAGAVPGVAHGGVIGGRGTGTSDSNLAWVSRGEHIMPARAVAQPGVLAFLEALRRSGGNLRHVLDGMGRFALGGLVPRPALAFAGGGAVGSMSHVTINFPGLQPIGGLRASAGAVEELRKAAALAQVRSGGRKPSRYS